MYKRIIVEATVVLTTTGSTTAQVLNYKVKAGSTTLVTLPLTMIAAADLPSTVVIRAIAEARVPQAITVTHGAAAADANTTSRFQTLTIYAEN